MLLGLKVCLMMQCVIIFDTVRYDTCVVVQVCKQRIVARLRQYAIVITCMVAQTCKNRSSEKLNTPVLKVVVFHLENF